MNQIPRRELAMHIIQNMLRGTLVRLFPFFYPFKMLTPIHRSSPILSLQIYLPYGLLGIRAFRRRLEVMKREVRTREDSA